MKIYREIIMEWDDEQQALVEVSSDSYEYEGPLALCWWETAIGIGLSIFGANQSADSSKEVAQMQIDYQKQVHEEQQRRRDLAYAEAKKLTPEEIAYKGKLSERALQGDPDLAKRQNLQMQPIREMGEEGRLKAHGKSISQGLENSIIAHELRNKVDQQTIKSLNRVAEQIALYNDAYKRQYEDKLDAYNMQRANYLKDLAVSHIAGEGAFISPSVPSTGTLMQGMMGDMLFQMGTQMFTSGMSDWLGSKQTYGI